MVPLFVYRLLLPKERIDLESLGRQPGGCAIFGTRPDKEQSMISAAHACSSCLYQVHRRRLPTVTPCAHDDEVDCYLILLTTKDCLATKQVLNIFCWLIVKLTGVSNQVSNQQQPHAVCTQCCEQQGTEQLKATRSTSQQLWLGWQTPAWPENEGLRLLEIECLELIAAQ